jgi:transposase
MAHKLARLVYRMLRFGQEYVDRGTQYYEKKYPERQIELLKKNAAKLGFQLVEPQSA